MIARVLTAASFLLAPVAFAQTYIVPQNDCGAVELRLTRGTGAAFPQLGETIPLDRIRKVQIDSAKQRQAATPTSVTQGVAFDATIAENELLMAAVELLPAVVDSETRTAHAKALVRCGKVGDGGWRRSAGLGLEIFPQWNEGFALERGHEMRFIVVDNRSAEKGQLLREVHLELYRSGDGLVGSADSDAQGIVTFPETAPGKYLVTTTITRPDPMAKQRTLVDTSSLTFEVR